MYMHGVAKKQVATKYSTSPLNGLGQIESRYRTTADAKQGMMLFTTGVLLVTLGIYISSKR